MKEDVRLIDLNDWVRSGEGADAVSYYHKTDDSVVLRIDVRNNDYETARKEFLRSLTVAGLGVPTPMPREVVTDGIYYGTIFQRMSGKQSFSRMISEHPEKLRELAAVMASMAKELHSISCDTGEFVNVGKSYIDTINSCEHIPERLKVLLNTYASHLDNACTTCIHGDLQPGNVIRTGGRNLWIDIGKFGYGDPDLDFSSLYVLSHFTPKGIVKDLMHLSARQMREFTDCYGREYYGDRYDTAELQEKIRQIGLLHLGASFAVSDMPKAFRFFYIDAFYGNRLRSKFKMMLMDLFVRKRRKC